MALTENTRAEMREIIARYPKPRSALLPMLHLAQSEEGYVSPEGIAMCAEELGLTKAEVGAVATFYTMYKRRPTGEYLVSVCTNTLCGMLGGDDIYRALSERLGVGMNQTAGTPGTPGSITLEHAECLAACDYAPVVTVNYEFFDNQTVDSALGLLTELRAGNRPMPTRGAPLCSFREISRQIAGFVDQRPAAARAAATGAPTEAGVRLAQERGEQAPGYPPGEDAGSSSAHAEADAETAAANNTGKPDYTSSNDAPLNTVKSDPAAASPTGGQSERIDKAGPADAVGKADQADRGK